jgi:hypothetical protein
LISDDKPVGGATGSVTNPLCQHCVRWAVQIGLGGAIQQRQPDLAFFYKPSETFAIATKEGCIRKPDATLFESGGDRI